MSTNDFDVAVAGAGIVGMSTALWAQKSGLRVVICDPAVPGSGTTYGSACTIATYACVPINNPSIFTSLPGLLFSRESPLSINYRYALKNLGWMLSFLAHCRQDKVEHIGRTLGSLLSHSDEGLNPLIQEAGAEDLLVNNDCMYVWSTAAGYDAAVSGNRMRREQGVVFDELSASDVLDLEPALRLPVHRGLLFKGARHVVHPQKLVERMHKRFTELGGVTLASSVDTVTHDDCGVTVRLENTSGLRVSHFVAAAGAHSKRIRGSGIERLPLGVERGYHITFEEHGGLVSRPVGWAEGGLYATPMALGLRLAGTVELDDLSAPLNPDRIAYLRRIAVQMFGDIGEPQQEWLGYRPTMPDSLPVIGQSAISPRIVYAFGHQHLGLTLGGITGRIVTDLIQGREPVPDISALSSSRFR
jgi:glycine/D-amino acid oxidase-like deaminating enzyme